MFHVDSRWDEMAEMVVIPAKTYSIWNGWNPSRIWGESKDLSANGFIRMTCDLSN